MASESNQKLSGLCRETAGLRPPLPRDGAPMHLSAAVVMSPRCAESNSAVHGGVRLISFFVIRTGNGCQGNRQANGARAEYG